MSRWILRLLLCCVPLSAIAATGEAQARAVTARIARVVTAVATLEGVQVRLDWPAQAVQGRLTLRAAHLVAPDLGYRFVDLEWQCPLRRSGAGGWQCEGPLRSGGASAGPGRLAVVLDPATTDASLTRGAARLAIHRSAATPDATRIDLARVPFAWTQALLEQAWPEVVLTGGTVDAELTVTAADAAPLQIAGPLTVSAASLDTPDGRIAAEGLGAKLDVQARLGIHKQVLVAGELRGGELLFGSTYVSLADRSVGLLVHGEQSEGQGWRLPRLRWEDAGILSIQGSAGFTADTELSDLNLDLRSGDLAPLRDAYLSGWLGVAGLAQLQLSGAADARLQLHEGALRSARVHIADADITDPAGRFAFAGMDGDIAFSTGRPVLSQLGFRGGTLYGLDFDAASLRFESQAGELRLREAVNLPMLGGVVRFDQLRLRPPGGGAGLDVRFGLALDRLDVARFSEALDWPDFSGTLSGRIADARYADERLDFGGGLEMQLFGGTVAVSSLAMERPFGVAPTLSADIVLDDLDLESLTGVFGFGSITGTLDGSIGGLRLVDWAPTAFDAQLRSQRKRGVPQRISQRAVQDLSSVGDPSFAATIQAQLIGLFDDFGYSRIGISCRLKDAVCSMDGLASAGAGFMIVQGAGLPRLNVVGFNRQVDWPTLVERLAAVGSGEVTPVVE